MGSKKVAGTILSVSVRACALALIIMFLVLFGRKAYTFGVSIFNEKSMDSADNGTNVTVTIPSGSTNKEVAELLLEKGLIDDTTLFMVQLKLSDYSKSILPGTYTLSTTMKPTEIMEIISTEPESETT